MGHKGSWSRVKDHEAYRATLEAIHEREKKRPLELAARITGGRLVRAERRD